jgi:hypothetical protein
MVADDFHTRELLRKVVYVAQGHCLQIHDQHRPAVSARLDRASSIEEALKTGPSAAGNDCIMASATWQSF